MYHVSARSCSVLTRVAFLILSSTIHCVFHIDVSMNQNCSGSFPPMPLNTGNSIELVIITHELLLFLVPSILQFSSLSSPCVSHQTPLRQILVPTTEPFVGLYGPDLGSKELFSQENPVAIGPFSNSPRSTDLGLTRGSRGGCWNKVSAPLGCLDVVWSFRALFTPC